MLEQSRIAYAHFATLCRILNDYSSNQDMNTTNDLKSITQLFTKSGMPLPSGRYGNPLAVALEMQLYQV